MWLATDACGNSNSCSQTVTVICPECFAFSAKMAGNEVELSWSSLSNLSYQVQYRTNLTSGTWLGLGSPISGNGTTNRVYDTSVSSSFQRFYRLVWLGN